MTGPRPSPRGKENSMRHTIVMVLATFLALAGGSPASAAAIRGLANLDSVRIHEATFGIVATRSCSNRMAAW